MSVFGPLSTISARDRRTMLVGLGIILMAWVGLRGVPAVARYWAEQADRQQVVQESLARSRALLDAEGELRDSLTARAQRLVALAPRLFGGSSISESGAEFSSLLSGLADRRRIRLVRMDAQPAGRQSLFHRLAVRLEAEGDISGITRFLADVEGSEKLISITALEVQAPEPGAPAAQPERLRLMATMVAWAALTAEEATDAR